MTTPLRDQRPPPRCPFWVQYLLVSPLRRLVESPARLLGPHVEAGMTVIEPGCGFGYFTLPLARMVGDSGRVISLDVEPRVVDRMLKRARKAGLEARIDGRVCKPADLGLAELVGQADLAVMMHMLHEIEAQQEVLHQVHGLLKPGGRLLVIEPRGHVSRRRFDAEVGRCHAAGFVALPAPHLGKRHLGALLGRREDGPQA